MAVAQPAASDHERARGPLAPTLADPALAPPGLRPDDDQGLFELAVEAELGIHDPADMPFTTPWTEAPPEDLAGNVLRHHWQLRAAHRPNDWKINFLIRLDGRVIGTQTVYAKDFSVTRQIRTGSWIGRRRQGNGYGKEVRAAA